MRIISYLIIIIAGITLPSKAFAFRDHALLTYSVFSDVRNSDEFSALRQNVKVESMNEFFTAISKDSSKYRRLRVCLENVDQECLTGEVSIPGYRKVPDALKLPVDSSTLNLSHFLDAIRVSNPLHPNASTLESASKNYQPYVRRFLRDIDHQPDLGPDFSNKDKQTLDVAISYDDTVESLKSGDTLPAFEVLTTACDEPDYVMDLNLWQEAGSNIDRYGFGIQPFGDGETVGSRAQFHSGFFHESWIINKIVPSFTQSYTEYRIRLFTALAKFSFREKHNYWGWRFMGWAMHYVQDLCQPYHTTLVPGKNTAQLVIAGILYKLRISNAAYDYGIIAAKEHMGFELYVYGLLNFGLNQNFLNRNPDKPKNLRMNLKPGKCDCCHSKNPNSNDVIFEGSEQSIRCVLKKLLPSIKNPTKRQMPKIAFEKYPRDEISANARKLASDLATVLQEPALPESFHTPEHPDKWTDLNKQKLDIENFDNDNCNRIVGQILENVATYSRWLLKEVVADLSTDHKKSAELLADAILKLKSI